MQVIRPKVIVCLSLLFLCLANSLSPRTADASEPPTLSWEVSLDSYPEMGGNGYDVMLDVVPTGDGGAVAAGYAIPPGSYLPGGKPQQAFIVRLDSFGTELWRRHLGELTGDYEALRIRRTVDGGFVVACVAWTPFGPGSGGIYYNTSFVAKLDSAGVELWRFRFDPLSLDEIGDLDILTDGSIVVAGRVWNPGGSTSTAVAKLSPAGALLWLRRQLPDHIQNVGKVSATPDGGFFVTSESGLEQTVSRYGPGGDHLWSVPIQGLDSDQYLNEKDVHGITVDPDGRCIIAGATRYNHGSTYGPFRPFLVTFDNRGRQSSTLVVPTQSVWVHAVAGLPDGGLVAAEGQEGSDTAPVFVRYDRYGNPQWRSYFGVTPGIRFINAVRVTAENGIVAAGAIRGVGTWAPLDGYVMTTEGMVLDRRADKGKTRAQLACERACHQDHGEWVDLCIANHDPREVTPNARGHCIAAGAERLQQCLSGCR